MEVSSLDMRAKRPRSQAGKDRRKSEWMIDVLRAEQVGEWMLIGCATSGRSQLSNEGPLAR